MAVYRNAPTCPYCGKVIAKEIHSRGNPYNPVYGDSFLRWDYKPHWCIKGAIAKRKERKEFKKRMKEKGIDVNNLFNDMNKQK